MNLRSYETRDDLMDELADLVASEIEQALKAKGSATLSVPGGTTPAPFLNALSEIDLDWANVNIMLNDERFVGKDSERSNTRLLRENLLINEAARAKFVPFVVSDDSPEQSAQSAARLVDAVLPIDVLIVGMGEDMHTASLFPDSPDLDRALSVDAPSLVVIRAANAGEPRISLSANALRAARFKHVLIAGEAKKVAYMQALSASNEKTAPVRVVLINDQPATVHYAK